ncbi:hypothetical protein [Magnetospirillum moscoviense]|uniref:Uncharacterized protein n=1 Tax=Magnetospirillum moscoviense TaxID=1437059 RepID=A0A178MKZ2_9PROT|nr:hypothetical protein [Magnetospirillum moscoviense]MBF0327513.1 hypothetical protein [Alphaproteobacteria bacterium]OAN49402.1 hypothetical protein A6A05_14080 [Magnetospirillum moscoviense]
MRRILIGVLGLILSAHGAMAAEKLQVPQLLGWKVIVSLADRNGETTELIPGNEAAESWTRRATIQAFRGTPLTAQAFLDTVVTKTGQVCEQASAGPSSLGMVGGREAGSRTVACGRYKGDGRGSMTLYFVVRGKDAFYVVSRAWRGEPFAQGTVPVSAAELAEWVAYMNAVDLCDNKDPNRPCR